MLPIRKAMAIASVPLAGALALSAYSAHDPPAFRHGKTILSTATQRHAELHTLPVSTGFSDKLSAALSYVSGTLSVMRTELSSCISSRFQQIDNVEILQRSFAVKREKTFEDAINDALSQAFNSQSPQQPQIVHTYGGYPQGRIPSTRKLVYGIVGANVGVYLMWKIPSLQSFMHNYFITSARSLFNGWRGWLTNLTCTYSHLGLLHLGLNMMGFLSFAPRLMEGRSSAQAPKMSMGEFFTFYTVSGVLASVSSNVLNVYARISNPSLGASGAIFSVLSYYCLSYPNAGVLVLFIPMTAASALLLGSAVNVYLVGRTLTAHRFGVAPPAVDGMAHLAGTVAGVAYYYFKRSREGSRQNQQRAYA